MPKTHIFPVFLIVPTLESGQNHDCFLALFSFAVRLGFAGNHPFLTLSLCWKISRIDHRQLNAVTPTMAETTVLLMKSDAMPKPIPQRANTHQHFVPK